MTRRQPDGVSIRRFERLDDLADEAQSLLGSTLTSSAGWLRVVERSHESRAAYLAAYSSGNLAGLLPYYVVERGLASAYRPEAVLADILPRQAITTVDLPAVYLGSVNGYSNELMLRPDLSPSRRQATVRALFDAAWGEAVSSGAKAMYFLFASESGTTELTDFLAQRIGFGPIALPPETSLTVAWPDFTAYLGALSHRRRKKIRQELRAAAGLGIVYRRVRLSEVVDLVAPMVVAVRQRHSQTDLDSVRRYLALQADELDAASLVTLAERDSGEPIGATIAYVWGGELYVRNVCFDFSSDVPFTAVYFDLTYYQQIEAAIDLRLSRVWFGINSYEPKLHRGARLEARWGILWPLTAAVPDSGWLLLEDVNARRIQSLLPGFLREAQNLTDSSDHD